MHEVVEGHCYLFLEGVCEALTSISLPSDVILALERKLDLLFGDLGGEGDPLILELRRQYLLIPHLRLSIIQN